MAATVIRGINNSYPLVISAIRNIAVKGACRTPAIRPAIETRLKLLIDNSSKKKWLTNLANTKPSAEPKKSAGAKTPPIPPTPTVTEVAIILKKIIENITKSKADSLVQIDYT